MRQKIVLTFPKKSHEPEDLRSLFEEFKQADPARFKAWVQIERKGLEIGPDDLKDIQSAFYEFMKPRINYNSNAALVLAFNDFRNLLAKDILGN